MTLVDPNEDLARRVSGAIKDEPRLRYSAGRVPSPAWIRTELGELKGRAQNEEHLIAMLVARRIDMVERVQRQRTQ